MSKDAQGELLEKLDLFKPCINEAAFYKEKKEAYEALRTAIEEGQPKASREFVEKWAKCIDVHDYDPGIALSSKKIVLGILREAGVEVEDTPPPVKGGRR